MFYRMKLRRKGLCDAVSLGSKNEESHAELIPTWLTFGLHK
jgi:hypothetical protein